jgi:hypothetical protein
MAKAPGSVTGSVGANGEDLVALTQAGGDTYVYEKQADNWRGPLAGPPHGASIRSTDDIAIAISHDGTHAYRFENDRWLDFGAVTVGDFCMPRVVNNEQYIVATGCDGGGARLRSGGPWVPLAGTNPVATGLADNAVFAYGDQTSDALAPPAENKFLELPLTPPAKG